MTQASAPSSFDSVPVKILVYQRKGEASQSEWVALEQYAPASQLIFVKTEAEYQQILDSESISVVIFVGDLEELVESMRIPELRFRNVTPGVLVVAEPSNPVAVASLYNAGCHRLIAREDGWMSELGQGVRSVLRLKKAEEAYERTRAKLTEMNSLLLEKNRRLDEFSVSIAHDIRGPLGGITMKLDYLLEKYATEFNPRVKEIMVGALESSQRLTDVVQGMYEYARLGAKAAKMAVLPLKKLVEEVTQDLHFDEKLDIKIGVGDLPEVWGNADLLRRVFINLINNAVKYNDKNEVLINIGTSGYQDHALGRYATVFVSDNGPGISLDNREKLFSMFTRGVGSNRSGDGLGIGLAVVQRVMELHMGSVEVQSVLGKGTTFLLTLPLEEANLLT